MATIVSPADLSHPRPSSLRAPNARAQARVQAYWRSFGLLDENHLLPAVRRLVERVQELHPAASPRELSTLALREAVRSIDAWLNLLLDPASAGPQARAVLLMRLRELLADNPELFLAPEAAARIGPEPLRILPEPLPAPMPPQSFSRPEPLPRPDLCQGLSQTADGVPR